MGTIRIREQVIDDSGVSGLILTVTQGEYLNKITVESLAIPSLNRDIYFAKDGTLDGFGTMLSTGGD